MLLLVTVLFMPAAAQTASSSNEEVSPALLERTLDMLPGVYAQRRARLFRCSIYATKLAEAGVSPASLPPFMDPELFARLTDGDLGNGEFFGLGVCADGSARLSVEVPAGTAYRGTLPDRNLGLGRWLFYSEMLLDQDTADALCRADQKWCSDCQ